MTEKHIGRHIARAMITIFIFQIFWKFGGFIVKMLAFRQFGAEDSKHILDAYTFAEGTIVWTLYVVFDKLIFPTFLPLFSEERELRGEASAWQFANTCVNLLMLALLGTVTACVWWAPQVVNLIAPQWVAEHPDTAAIAIRFCRWMLPALFFLSLGSFTHATLNSYKRFAYAAAGAGLHRFAHAVVFVLAFWVFGAPAIWAAIAFFVASPAKPLIHLIGLRDKVTGYRLRIPYWRETLLPALRWTLEMLAVVLVVLLVVPLWWPQMLGPSGATVRLVLLTGVAFFFTRGLVCWVMMRRVRERTLLQKLYLLAYPLLMGEVIARLRDLVQDSYATHLEQDGLFGAIKIAKSIGEMPLAVLPLALSMAMFPFLCDMFTKQNREALAEVVSRTLKMIVLFFLPLTVITVILRQPVIELLASKEVSADLVGSTALALAAFALSFVFYASEMVLMQTYFSLQNTWLPTVIGAVSSFAQVAFLFIAFDMVGSADSAAGAWLRGVGVTPFIVVALAYPISRAFKNVVLGGVLHFELKLFHLRDVLSFVPQAVLVTAATGAAAWGAWAAVSSVGLTAAGKVIRLGVPSAAAGVAFLGALFALKLIGWPVAEFDIILRWLHESGWQKIQRRLRGRKPPKSKETE